MYGVVLWSNFENTKAVIWCEDQGDLAFYSQDSSEVPVTLDAGDLVQFDMTTDRHLRYAHNPRQVQEGIYADLVETLSDKVPPVSTPKRAVANHARGSAQIIPFEAARADRRTADGFDTPVAVRR